MEIINNPEPSTWSTLAQRPVLDNSELIPRVQEILNRVKTEGDAALKVFTQQFDGTLLERLSVTVPTESNIDEELKAALELAKSNIETFHKSQQETVQKITTQPGVTCWRKSIPIQKVGLYIPGGSAPLFSTLLMLAIPAQIAGCEQLVLCTPLNKSGEIDPTVLYCAKMLGISTLYPVGGAQAIAAMAYGTETIPKVDKIFGPGNQYVTTAKQLVQQEGTAIDMPAGPSEVLVIADANANPEYVAADLLSQAEHGPDSQVIFLSDSNDMSQAVVKATENQLENLPRKAIAEQALNNSKAIAFDALDTAMNFSNIYAPEHLILATDNAIELAEKVINAGSVFLGKYSCESAGDYASGTNHTLPTNGFARNYSGVSLDSFLKKVTFQEITASGLANIGPAIEQMAAAEQLFAHKNAVSIRLKDINNG
ncbi:MAG: histidinol dehydrogenase [Crocinitomicaceae bacterium]|nr:histidinol dehydrogenase [Crocinitomicaceae bacterium]